MNQRSILTRQLRYLRRDARRLAAMIRWRRFSLAGVPVLFANSFPKSGTHLLTQVLQGFPKIGPAVESGLPAVVTFRGDTGHARPESDILADLRRLHPGDIGYGHVHALPGALELLGGEGYAAYFILRDPRDVVVSHVHYITEMEPGHIHHRYYTEELHTFDERLRTSILGLPHPQIPFPDIQARFEPYLGWLDCPGMLTLRFEDFIHDRAGSLERVLAHAEGRGFPTLLERGRALQLLDESINPQRSPTFRSGKVGGWKARFNEENTRLFKEIGGDLLIRLGYETGNDW